jgi:hypothetical protein
MELVVTSKDQPRSGCALSPMPATPALPHTLWRAIDDSIMHRACSHQRGTHGSADDGTVALHRAFRKARRARGVANCGEVGGMTRRGCKAGLSQTQPIAPLRSTCGWSTSPENTSDKLPLPTKSRREPPLSAEAITARAPAPVTAWRTSSGVSMTLMGFATAPVLATP